MQTDFYGIPESIFGPLDPELPALIGRIVMLAALAESKVDALASSVARKLQSDTAGQPFLENLRICRQSLALSEDFSSAGSRQAALALLDEVEIAMQARNAVAHRVWPKAGSGSWGGWKPIPKRHREEPAVEWTDWRNFARDDLVNDVARWVGLIERLGDALTMALGGQLPRVPALSQENNESITRHRYRSVIHS